MKRIVFLNLLILFFSSFVFAQEMVNPISTEKKITKNVVYLESGGGYGGFQMGLNYERVVFAKKGHSVSLKGTYGLFTYLIPTGDYYNLAGCYSYGRRYIHIETAFGISVFDFEEKLRPFYIGDFKTLPLVYVGCKLKKPTGNFVMKLGVGFPTNVCWGIGFAF